MGIARWRGSMSRSAQEISPATLQELYEERAGIMEFLGNLPREAAEELARKDVYENPNNRG